MEDLVVLAVAADIMPRHTPTVMGQILEELQPRRQPHLLQPILVMLEARVIRMMVVLVGLLVLETSK